MPFDIDGCEVVGVVEEAHIDASSVGSFDKQRGVVAVVSVLQFGGEVVETANVLHLSHAYASSTDRGHIESEPRDGVCHVVYLVFVFEPCPMHASVGQILIVVLTLVVNSVEEVLEVIESDALNGIRLCFCLCLVFLGGKRNHAKSGTAEEEEGFFHNYQVLVLDYSIKVLFD